MRSDILVRTGQHFGPWTLKARLGRGGNGEVWRAASAEGDVVAIKFLTKLRPVAYQRFRREVRTLESAGGMKGVLPIIDAHLPSRPSPAVPPWFSMSEATPLEKRLRARTLGAVVEVIASLANTLAVLHGRGIAHRDIKTSNLYWYLDEWCVGDFGLVDLADGLDLTRTGEEVGPKWSIAPEMRRNAWAADGTLADVYSLAKVLWILVSGEPRGFEGQYVPSSASIGLRRYVGGSEYVLDLDEILVRCTDHAPANRMSMRQFQEALRSWQRTVREYHTLSLSAWGGVLRTLFPLARPQRVRWERLDDVVRVLQLIASAPDGNHMFYPSGGGNDLGHVRLASEPGCIELRAGSLRGPSGAPRSCVLGV